MLTIDENKSLKITWKAPLNLLLCCSRTSLFAGDWVSRSPWEPCTPVFLHCRVCFSSVLGCPNKDPTDFIIQANGGDEGNEPQNSLDRRLQQISNIRRGPSLSNPYIPDLGGLFDRQPTGKIVILFLILTLASSHSSVQHSRGLHPLRLDGFQTCSPKIEHTHTQIFFFIFIEKWTHYYVITQFQQLLCGKYLQQQNDTVWLASEKQICLISSASSCRGTIQCRLEGKIKKLRAWSEGGRQNCETCLCEDHFYFKH